MIARNGHIIVVKFIDAFGGIIREKDMSPKELDQLFMRIDADSNGSVEWHEFMNYMLLENQTLNAMKKEHFNYEKSDNDGDPPPGKNQLCHTKNITSIVVLYPEDLADSSRQQEPNRKSPEYIK